MSGLIGFLIVFWIFILAFLVFILVALWKLFEKAGEPGWKAIIPFYNYYILFKISWGNGWYSLFITIPSVFNQIFSLSYYDDYTYPSGGLVLLTFLLSICSLVFSIIMNIKLAKAFGKDGGWACGLIFLGFVFLPIMAFSKDIVYVGIPGKTPAYGNSYGQQNYQQPNYQNPYPQGYQNPYIQQNNYQQTGYQVPNQQQSSQNSQYYYQQPTAQGATKYCSGCGSQVENGGMFCPKCGKPQ